MGEEGRSRLRFANVQLRSPCFVGCCCCCCLAFVCGLQPSSHPSTQGIDLGDNLEGGRSPTERTSLLAKVLGTEPPPLSFVNTGDWRPADCRSLVRCSVWYCWRICMALLSMGCAATWVAGQVRGWQRVVYLRVLEDGLGSLGG